MTNGTFKGLCTFMHDISLLSNPDRERRLNEILSAGYLYLSLTDRQVREFKALLKRDFPDKYVEYPEPDSHGFTAEFEYLRFK